MIRSSPLIAVFLLTPLSLSAQEPTLKATFAHEQTFSIFLHPVVVFSGDGNTLASAHGTTVRLWDVKTGKEKAVLNGQTGKVTTVAFSGDGKLLAAGCGGLVKLWDVATGKDKTTFKQPLPYNFGVRCVVFSGDNKTLASGTKGEVYLWDVATGKLRATLHRYKMPESVAFGGGGNLLAVGSGGTGGLDGEPPKVFLWEIP